MIRLAYLGFVAVGLPDSIPGVAWPGLRTEFGLSEPALGLLLAGLAMGYAGAALVSGHLIGRLGSGVVLTVAAGVAGLGALVEATAPIWPVLLAGAAASGFGGGAIDAALNGFVATRGSTRQVNWLHGCYGVGASIGPPLVIASLAVGGSWRAGFGCAAVVMGAMSAIFAVSRRRWTGPRGEDGARRAGWWEAATHRLVLIQIVLFFVYTGFEATLGQWAFSVLTEARGMAAGPAGVWTGTFWGSIAVGRFLIGIAVDRVGADRLVRLCTVTAIAGAALFAVAPTLVAPLGLIVAGLALAPIFPTLIARAPDRLGPAVALHAVGFKVSAAMVGSAALPALAGIAAARFGLVAVGWVAVIAAVALFGLHETLLRMAAVTRPGLSRPGGEAPRT